MYTPIPPLSPDACTRVFASEVGTASVLRVGVAVGFTSNHLNCVAAGNVRLVSQFPYLPRGETLVLSASDEDDAYIEP